MKKIILSFILLYNTICKGKDTKDFYKILGVPKDVGEAQLKRAYKKSIIRWHPDKNQDKKELAEQKTSEVNLAYEVLSNPDKRASYDRLGYDAWKKQEDQGNQGGGSPFDFFGGFGGFPGGGSGQKVYVNGMEMDMDDFQANFGGGGGGRGGRGSSVFSAFKTKEIRQLTEENVKDFDFRRCPWLLIFASNEDSEHVNKFETIAQICKDNSEVIECAYINCQQNNQLCFNYDAYDTPIVKIYPENSTQKPENIDLKFKDLAGLIKNKAFNMIPNYTKSVTITNFDEFKAQDPEKAKILLYTDKDNINPLIKTMSNLFRSQILIGIVREKQQTLIKMFKITKFPSLVYISDYSNYSEVTHYDFENKINKTNLRRFLNEALNVFTKFKRDNEYKFKDLLPKNLKHECSSKESKICIIISEKDNKIAEKFKKDPVKFYYMSVDQIKEVKEILGVEGENLKGIVYRSKKNSAIGIESGSDFLSVINQVVSGSASFKSVNSI